MNKFKAWYLNNQVEITWFIIGVLTLQGLQEAAREEYVQAGISFAIVLLNYSTLKR